MPDLSDALAYANKGWRVIPIPPGQKNPVLTGWPSQATTDPGQITQWWLDCPDLNIAVLTGKKSGIVVFDIDGEEGEHTLAKLTEKHGPLPPTYAQETPHGGHYFFKAPDTEIQGGIKVWPGIDILSEGRCAVLAPSVVEGKYYAVSNDAAPAPLPNWIIAKSLEQEPISAGASVLQAAGQSNIPKGERNNRLFRYACQLRARGVSKKDARTLLINRNEQSCKPPLPKKEVLQCQKSAWNHRPPYDLNDTGNAKRLIHLFGDSIRKPTHQKVWLVRDGDLWRPDEDGTVVRMAKEVVESIRAEARNEIKSERRKKHLLVHAKASGNRSKIESLIKLAESEDGIAVPPDKINADPYLIGLRDKVFDLRKGAITETNEIISKRSFVSYDPTAMCPRWLKFLDEVFDGDKDLTRYIQKAIGYSLTGMVSQQCLFFLYGGGANGKTTFLSILRSLMGEYARTVPQTVLMAKGQPDYYAVASLQGARLAVAVEVAEDSRFDEVSIKQLTGGDPVSGRHLYEDFFEFTPQFKLWISGNHKPTIRGTDIAIWRRIKLIPFTVSFPKSKQDVDLDSKLKAELRGILNWAITGCQDWISNGLKEPKVVKAATSKYRSESDILGQFLGEECKSGSLSQSISASTLYKAYQYWCDESGNREMTKTQFGRKLGDKGIEKKKTSKGIRYIGLTLRQSIHKFGQMS
jgi:putative DNA primase/helicase